MSIGRRVRVLAAFAAVILPAAANAASETSWDGTWIGMLNNSEPVSVTISGGKVVSYAIRGGQPFDIAYSEVTRKTVSFGDHANYDVKITKVGGATASGFAHGPMGDGSATLKKQ
jgi:hypothetical protein